MNIVTQKYLRTCCFSLESTFFGLVLSGRIDGVMDGKRERGRECEAAGLKILVCEMNNRKLSFHTKGIYPIIASSLPASFFLFQIPYQKLVIFY